MRVKKLFCTLVAAADTSVSHVRRQQGEQAVVREGVVFNLNSSMYCLSGMCLFLPTSEQANITCTVCPKSSAEVE